MLQSSKVEIFSLKNWTPTKQSALMSIWKPNKAKYMLFKL